VESLPCLGVVLPGLRMPSPRRASLAPLMVCRALHGTRHTGVRVAPTRCHSRRRKEGLYASAWGQVLGTRTGFRGVGEGASRKG